MILSIVTPPTAQQVNPGHSLRSAGIEHPLAGKVLNTVRQHGSTPANLWRVINTLADAENPDYRARRRCWRLRYWGAIRELLKAKLLFRHGPLISTSEFAVPKSPTKKPALSSRRAM
jgi:hypothetical protein